MNFLKCKIMHFKYISSWIDLQYIFRCCGKLVSQKIFQPSGARIPGVGQFISDFQERVICDHIMLKRNVIVIVTATIFELFFQK